jgi:hypothetical protein
MVTNIDLTNSSEPPRNCALVRMQYLARHQSIVVASLARCPLTDAHRWPDRARRGSGAHRRCAASLQGPRGGHGSDAPPLGRGPTGGDAAIRRSRRRRPLRLGRSPRQGSPARPARGPDRTLFGSTFSRVRPKSPSTAQGDVVKPEGLSGNPAEGPLRDRRGAEERR